MEQYDVILPSNTSLSEDEISKIKRFIRRVAVVALANSLLNLLDNNISQDFGVKYLGVSLCDADYTLVKDILYPIFVKTPFLNYKAATKIKPIVKVEVFADIFEPYFNRTWSIIVHIKKLLIAKNLLIIQLLSKMVTVYFLPMN